MLAKRGNLNDRHKGKYVKKIDPEKFSGYMEEHPDVYLYAIAAIFSCLAAAVCRTLYERYVAQEKAS